MLPTPALFAAVHALLALLGAATLVRATAPEASRSPPLKIWLQAGWDAPPMGVLALETLADANPKLFWPVLEHVLASQPANIFSLSAKQQYDAVMDRIDKHQDLTSTQKRLIRFSIGLRAQAARVQAYYHYYTVSVVPSLHKSYNDCQVWIHWLGEQICDVGMFSSILENTTYVTGSRRQVLEAVKPKSRQEDFLPFDHIYMSSAVDSSAPAFILYTDLIDPPLKELHQNLVKIADEYKLRYILRYKPVKFVTSSNDSTEFTGYDSASNLAASGGGLYLSGWGAELAIKSTEYKVIDDRKLNQEDVGSDDKQTHDESDKVLDDDTFLTEAIPQIKALSKYDMKSIALKAAEYILHSPNPLASLSKVSSNFPQYAHLLTSVNRTIKFPSPNSFSQFGAPQEEEYVRINGLQLDLRRDDVFKILRLLQQEAALITRCQQFGLNTSSAIDFLVTKFESSAAGSTFDIRSPDIIWWNNLESDTRYADFPKSLYALLQPSYPGRLRSVAKNYLNVLFVLDLSSHFQLGVILDCFDFINRYVPVRFGFVPVVDAKNPLHLKNTLARAVHVLLDAYSKVAARDFLVKIWRLGAQAQGMDLTNEDIRLAYVEATSGKKAKRSFGKDASFEEAIRVGDGSLAHDYINRIVSFNSRIQVGREGGIFINGEFTPLYENYQQLLVNKLFLQTERVAEMVASGGLKDSDNILDKVLSRNEVYKTRNAVVFSSELNPLRFIDITALPRAHNVFDSLGFVHAAGEKHDPNLSIVVVGDFKTSQAARKLLADGLRMAASNAYVRLSVLSNSLATDHSLPLDALFQHLSKTAKSQNKDFVENIATFVQTLDADAEWDADAFREKATEMFAHVSSIAAFDLYSSTNRTFAQDVTAFLTETLKFRPGNAGLVVNGRVIGPFVNNKEVEQFDLSAWSALPDFELKARVETVAKTLSRLVPANVYAKHRSDFVMKATSLIVSANIERENNVGFGGSEIHRHGQTYMPKELEKVFVVSGNREDAIFRVSAVLNPLSETTQKWSSILKVLGRMPEFYIEIKLIPDHNLEELPLKRFYRYVLDVEPTFGVDGRCTRPAALFSDLPQEPLYTVGMDVPEAWLVTAVSSMHDLDNVKLNQLGSTEKKRGVEAVYKLRSIIMEGHARDPFTSTAPRGLQFILGTSAFPDMVDTITMANYGYFQLQANPGVWRLRLREGRSSDVCQILEVSESFKILFKTGIDNVVDENVGALVVLDKLDGLTSYVRTMKKKGKEQEDLLEADNDKDDSGWWGKVKRTFGAGSSKNANGTVNVFSVASGHLYERFMSIMMLSVRKNTQNRLKFWLIEQFLSPSFKAFIPYLAEQAGFEYEFVTYRWPHWLRSQKEKQRTIWAYKILFLDVLFPLSLDKIIFVDADQVVRADLKELVNLDLNGAPYGYTPFCDSREGMDTFRFWKSGYWANHLQGKPYHISALYVIDLVRFRGMAAGDRLRQQYQSLSADPNSLANLDQDLPNNMQHSVPIFSLPQEWLWCETWCSDESLTKAKTIDLCNNPKTKEPKLERAKRILPEWEALDKEVGEYMAAFQKREDTNSTMIAPLSTKNSASITLHDKPGRNDEL